LANEGAGEMVYRKAKVTICAIKGLREAFTLIELLVVIFHYFAADGILLPVLAKGEGKGQNCVLDTGNQGKVARALNCFASETMTRPIPESVATIDLVSISTGRDPTMLTATVNEAS